MKPTAHLQMPELIISQYEVQLSEEKEKRYEELKADFILELPEGEITAVNAASLTGSSTTCSESRSALMPMR